MDNLIVPRMYVGYTTNKALAEEVFDFLQENNRNKIEIKIEQLGVAVGVHVGNDAVGYGFIGNYHPKMFTEFGNYSKSLVKEKKGTISKG